MEPTIDVSEVSVRFLDKEENGLLGFASCVVAIGPYSFFLNNITIRRRAEDGSLYAAYPMQTSKKGVEHFIWKPINRATNAAIASGILGPWSPASVERAMRDGG